MRKYAHIMRRLWSYNLWRWACRDAVETLSFLVVAELAHRPAVNASHKLLSGGASARYAVLCVVNLSLCDAVWPGCRGRLRGGGGCAQGGAGPVEHHAGRVPARG